MFLRRGFGFKYQTAQANSSNMRRQVPDQSIPVHLLETGGITAKGHQG